MTFSVPHWIWVLLVVLLALVIVWVGNSLHIWTLHFTFGF